MQQSMIKCKSWFSRTHWAKIVFVLSVARCAYIHFTVSPSPSTSPAPSRLASHILSLSTRSRIIQAFRYIRAWLADFDIKCERANTRSTRGPPPSPFPSHSTQSFPSLSVSVLSFCSYRSIPTGLGCFTLLGSFIRAPLSFRVLIGNSSKMIPPDAMLYARKYSGRNLISTVVFPCKV